MKTRLSWLTGLIVALLTAAPAPAQRTFVVNTTAGPGDGVCDASECTLYEAIEAANEDDARDHITFDIPGDGPHSIRPDPFLPLILEPVVIDGYTQQGTAPASDEGPAVLMIEVDGSSAASDVHGFEIESDDTMIRGLVVNRFARGAILIFGSNNRIEGNYLGTDVSGTQALGNGFESNDDVLYDGVWIVDGTGNTIGGSAIGQRNVISGNANAGVFISGQGGNRIEGSLVGTDATGTVALPNESPGVTIFGSPDNVVHNNVISGNLWFGVDLFESTDNVGRSTGNVITGNLIGTDITGSDRIGNEAGGILFNGSNNTVGGVEASDRNVISGNLGSGIVIFDPEGPISSVGNRVIGNWVGLTLPGSDTLRNLGTGIRLAGSSNVVGGPAPGEGNVVAGSIFAALSIRGDETADTVAHNVVQGNFFGTNAEGSEAPGNIEDGVAVIQSRDNIIGGEEDGAGNVIAGNFGGVFLFGEESTGNVVQGNRIGVDTAGTVSLPNLNWGVDIFEAAGNSIIENLIANNGEGGVNVTNVRPAGKRARPYASKVVASRDGHGHLRYAPFSLGQETDWPEQVSAKSLQAGRGNRVVDNRMFNNGPIGIDLGQDGRTSNDPGDPDDGPNRLQNFPELEEASADQTTLSFFVNLPSTTSNSAYPVQIHVYLADDSGQGSRPIAAVSLPANRAGETVEFVVDIDEPLAPGSAMVATATDADGNTSEFSESIEVETGPVAIRGEDRIPGGFVLRPNYPNPFKGSTTITYVLDTTAEVTLRVVDELGREVARPLDRVTRPAGVFGFDFHASRLPSGVYTFVLDTDGRRLVRRMTVLN